MYPEAIKICRGRIHVYFEVMGGSQQLTILEPEVSLTGNEWQKYPIVTGPEVPCILGIDYLRGEYFTGPKRALLGFWDRCLRDRGNQTAEYLACFLRGLSCCGFDEDQITADTCHYHYSALPAIPHQPGLCGDHPRDDS